MPTTAVFRLNFVTDNMDPASVSLMYRQLVRKATGSSEVTQLTSTVLFKVIRGHHFRYQSKALCDFLSRIVSGLSQIIHWVPLSFGVNPKVMATSHDIWRQQTKCIIITLLYGVKHVSVSGTV